MQFTHLHTHSHYSLLDGLSKIDDLIDQAVKFKMEALAITDHGNLYGAIEFYKKAKAKGIKPIIGLEAYIATRSHLDKQPGIDQKRYHLTLLAKNLMGYKNLLKLVTISNLEGFYYKPRIDRELLQKYSEGLICLSGCLTSELSQTLKNKDLERAQKIVLEHREIFGKENYFLEIMNHPKIEGFKTIQEKIIQLSRETGIPLVATQDSHYLNPEDAEAQDTLIAIQTNAILNDETRLTMKKEDFSFINQETALKYFKDIPEAIENTALIASRSNLELELGQWVFPDFKIPENTTHDSELTRLAYEGLLKRGLEKTQEIEDRIQYELKIISQKKFSPYFLVVSDLIRFSRENDILTNVRGSVAGSLITYLIEITNINPLKYKLPFERFLNPERPSPPDIDMDFADNRRDEVISYTRLKYGQEKVAQIGTFGTMMAKGSIRDVTRALGHSYATGDRIANLIPLGSQGFPMTIDQAFSLTPELKKSYKEDDTVKKIIDLAKKLEGCIRHISVHAAGVVVAPRSLDEFTPLQFDPKGDKIITQYDMHAIEDVGLLKLDFLGIRNLAILSNAVRLIKETHDIDINLDQIPLDDKKTFHLLAKGETMGLFQLNGAGLTRYLKELKPSIINDINAIVALYRPGPLESISKYIERKHNPSLIKYLDPRLKEILIDSYGVITYQDDVLLIAIKLAGYSWLEADKLRKAMGKKIPKEMKDQEEKLKRGLVNNGLSQEKTEELWKLIEPFAAYGFGKAHAASYGLLAYQTAYMKACYPVEYMTAILTAESGDNATISEYIQECKRMKITILPGQNIVDAIIDSRSKEGRFTSLEDFIQKVKHKDLNKKSLESLIKCGALDIFGERNVLLANSEKILEFSREYQKNGDENQINLFENLPQEPIKLKLDPAEPIPKNQKLFWEKELLGLYISDHPLNSALEKYHKTLIKISDLVSHNQKLVVIGGLIAVIKKVITKKGQPMLFVQIEDLTGRVEAIVFPKTLAKNEAIWQTDKIVLIKGRVSSERGEYRILVEEVKVI
ncbi:DNA polymerase III subunit alpha [Candidatus Azambacteria bacterium]|nr:DNA polymerase III subunit alpha [Candidatus Azambacteria bacterium]